MDWANLLENFAFPLVACIYMAWQNNKLSESLKELTVAINSIKNVVDNMNHRIEVIENKL